MKNAKKRSEIARDIFVIVFLGMFCFSMFWRTLLKGRIEFGAWFAFGFYAGIIYRNVLEDILTWYQHRRD